MVLLLVSARGGSEKESGSVVMVPSHFSVWSRGRDSGVNAAVCVVVGGKGEGSLLPSSVLLPMDQQYR